MKKTIDQLKSCPRMGSNSGIYPSNSIEGLIDMINHIGGLQNKTICEIGCFLGVSTETFLNFNPKKLYAVDIWGLNMDYNDCDWIPGGRPNFENIESQFRDMCKHYTNVEIIKNYSKYASFGFANELLDVVYIDGEHTYESVLSDITHWLPKIKKNGYMSGHDINFESVRTAVNVGLKNPHISEFSDSSWLVKIL
jgi:hypothetical protein